MGISVIPGCCALRALPLIMKHIHFGILFLLASIQLLAANAEVRLFSEVAVTAERPAGAPAYDDVCFRYGWIRKGTFPTVQDAKQAIRDFHATRVDWFYPGSHTMQAGATYVTPEAKAFIDWCHAENMKIGGTINNNTTNKDWAYKKHHLTRFVGEVRNPEFCEMVIAWGRAQIDAGVDTIVCDDIFKYGEMRQRLWSEQVLAKIKSHRPGFTIAGNNGHSFSTQYVQSYAVDYHYSDSNFIPGPSQFWQASKAHRALKSALIVQPNRPMTIGQQRSMIALSYASGAHVIAPWDAYIHGKKRLFSDPADYADLYGFARALGQLGFLKGYEDAAVGGYDLKEDRYGQLVPIRVAGGSGQLSVFGRAKPGNAKAPLVFHLAESGQPKASTLRLDRSTLGAYSLKAILLTPPAYDKAAHSQASATGDYKSLVEIQFPVLKTEGQSMVIELPTVTPWGLLILSPAG